MPAVVPHPFLFRFSFNAPQVTGVPKEGKRLLNLPDECVLPRPGELDEAESFGVIKLGWNDAGLAIEATVTGKTQPVKCSSRDPLRSDGLQVWIDTRNMQGIHRASQFCHHFCLLPLGKGQKQDQPYATEKDIARAREMHELADRDLLQVRSDIRDDGYTLEAFLPAEVLRGFDPEASPRLGFYSLIRDAELGDQPLTVDAELPFESDPSLWSTLELVS